MSTIDDTATSAADGPATGTSSGGAAGQAAGGAAEVPARGYDRVRGDSAPRVGLPSLDTLWFQVGGTLCNLACKHCFVSCSPTNHTHELMTLAEYVPTWKRRRVSRGQGVLLHRRRAFLEPGNRRHPGGDS